MSRIFCHELQHFLSFRQVQKKKKATNYCTHDSVTRYGPRNQLPERLIIKGTTSK